MKSFTRIILAIVMAGTITTAAGAQVKNATISDKVGKNQSTWTSDAPLEKIKGTAGGGAGRISVDWNDLTKMRGNISFQTSTMTTGNAMRDEHLASSSWLDATKYPTISFNIVSVSGVAKTGNKATGTVTGKFTLHGVTKTLTAPFTMKYIPQSPATLKRAPGDLINIAASFNVKLKDFNVTGTKGLVGNKVGETIQVAVNLFGATGL